MMRRSHLHDFLAIVFTCALQCAARDEVGWVHPHPATVAHEQIALGPDTCLWSSQSGSSNSKSHFHHNETAGRTQWLPDHDAFQSDHDVTNGPKFDSQGVMVMQPNQQQNTPIWDTGPSPGKGEGVFARGFIPAGTCIMTEEPLATVRLSSDYPDMEYPPNLVDDALERLDDREKEAFRSFYERRLPLHKREEETDEAPHGGSSSSSSSNISIIRSNAYILPDGRSALFPQISKINHSCKPNVADVWSVAAARRVIWAARDIHPGEELFTTYVPLLDDATTRQNRLAQYGFKCGCDACSSSTSHSNLSPNFPVRDGNKASRLHTPRKGDGDDQMDFVSNENGPYNGQHGQGEMNQEERGADGGRGNHSNDRRAQIAHLLHSARQALHHAATPSEPSRAGPAHDDMVHSLGEAELAASMLESEHLVDYLTDACRLVAELAYRVGDDDKAADWLRKELELRLNALVVVRGPPSASSSSSMDGNEEEDQTTKGEVTGNEDDGEDDGQYESLVEQWVQDEPAVKEALRFLDLAEGVVVVEPEVVSEEELDLCREKLRKRQMTWERWIPDWFTYIYDPYIVGRCAVLIEQAGIDV